MTNRSNDILWGARMHGPASSPLRPVWLPLLPKRPGKCICDTSRRRTLQMPSMFALKRSSVVTQVEQEPAQPLKSLAPPAPPPAPTAQPAPAPAAAPASKEQGTNFGSFFKGALDTPAQAPKVCRPDA